MTFDEWTKSEGLTWERTAALIGAANASVARKYSLGTIPRPTTMRRIYAVSGGKVTPNDFYGLPGPEPTEAAA
ncbi:XRE family transcriptional regulator [Magnetospirillum sulfuroxidans]|uniref:XRE family transcriptional regulator n=1 Tax=Magnetospirillum sulfuroxidans TaxID=611300 RepID=A0ABS5I8R2_9PROT|nr:XRE family transcriptional regulator [Magnetospirillum sulfuroxidans]MBR9970828.1 XRE family transcriptional regulator [Magnetospirillum sulfuroxidans]